MTRSRWAALGLLAGAFALGAVAGAIGTSAAEHRGPGHRRGGGREGYVDRLNAELRLSEPQKDSIRAVLKRHEPIMDSTWREVRPRFDSLRLELRDQIRAQLTPEQQQRYTDLLERRDREYRQRRTNGKP